VRERLKDELAYTTVLTVLRNLEAKGYVGHDEEGRAHRFRALVAREAARRTRRDCSTAALRDGRLFITCPGTALRYVIELDMQPSTMR